MEVNRGIANSADLRTHADKEPSYKASNGPHVNSAEFRDGSH